MSTKVIIMTFQTKVRLEVDVEDDDIMDEIKETLSDSLDYGVQEWKGNGWLVDSFDESTEILEEDTNFVSWRVAEPGEELPQ